MTDVKFLVPAAQYLRMSTEHQQYSPENQSTAIARYAEEHRFTVIRTYYDPAKSGLFLKNRRGLRDLLQDVTDGGIVFRRVTAVHRTLLIRIKDLLKRMDHTSKAD